MIREILLVTLSSDYFLIGDQTSLFCALPFIHVDCNLVIILTIKLTDSDLCVGLRCPVLYELGDTILKFRLVSPASWSNKNHGTGGADDKDFQKQLNRYQKLKL